MRFKACDTILFTGQLLSAPARLQDKLLPINPMFILEVKMLSNSYGN